jgi:hypothetical protein
MQSAPFGNFESDVSMYLCTYVFDAPAYWLTGALSQEAPALRLELVDPERPN